MDYIVANEPHAARPDLVIYSSAGRLRALPAAAVREIGQAAAAAVPFAPALFEGLVDGDGILAAQIDLPLAMGAAARGGRYSMLVETSRGLLRLRVDGVSFAGSAADEGTMPGLPEIEALIAGFAPADPLPQERPAVSEGPAAKPFEALVVKSGGVPAALPAAEVERVERHRGARLSRKGGAGERIVAVDGDILPGWSLAVWLDRGREGAAPEAEGWAVVMRVGGRRVALTVAEVRGVVAVPGERVRRIRHRDGASLWLPDPGGDSESGMIEVIESAEFGGVGGHAHSPAEAESDEEPAAAPPERRAADRGRFALGFGLFSCVVPESLIDEVLGELAPGRVAARRGRGMLPLLDPAPLLGLVATGAASGRALLLKRPGRRRLALRVAAIGPAAPAPDWRPLPILPPTAHRLFQAVRLEGAASAFLLRESAFDRPRDPVIAGLLRAAPAGWLGGF